MPVMDGLRATHAILLEKADAKIVLITNHDSAAMQQKALELGVQAYLPKEQLLDLPDLLASA